MNSDADRTQIVHAEAQRLEQYLSALSPEDWQQPSACDRWQVADVVAHLTNMRLADMITRGLQGDVTPLEGSPAVGTLNEDAFRESIAQRSMAFRERMGAQLLAAFIATNAHLDQVLADLTPSDWDTLCSHPMGPEPIRTLIDMRITELAIHGWDIRSRFEPQATLAPTSLPALCQTIPRAVRRAFRPAASRDIPIRYRFVVAAPVAVHQDIVLSPEGAYCEPANDSQADVAFQCATETYILVMFGRLTVGTAIREGRLAYTGPPALVTAFGQAFVGG